MVRICHTPRSPYPPPPPRTHCLPCPLTAPLLAPRSDAPWPLACLAASSSRRLDSRSLWRLAPPGGPQPGAERTRGCCRWATESPALARQRSWPAWASHSREACRLRGRGGASSSERGFATLSGVMNLASPSGIERAIWVPFAAVQIATLLWARRVEAAAAPLCAAWLGSPPLDWARRRLTGLAAA